MAASCEMLSWPAAPPAGEAKHPKADEIEAEQIEDAVVEESTLPRHLCGPLGPWAHWAQWALGPMAHGPMGPWALFKQGCTQIESNRFFALIF